MKALSLASCLLASASGLDFGGSDTTETLLLWQVLKSGGDMGTQQTMLPLLMSNLFDDSPGTTVGDDDELQQMLLMGSFSNPEMQSWMPFILGGKKSMTDKLILMQYLQMAENQGLQGMSELYPIMMMSEDRYCEKAVAPPATGTTVCECEETKSDSLLKIMLLTGGSFLGNSPQQNLFFLLFNDDEGCSCKREDDGKMEKCTESEIKGIDPMMMYFMMSAIPTPLQQQPAFVPRSNGFDVKQLLMSQMSGLPQEYQYLMNVDSTSRKELMKLQLYQTIGVPPALIELFSAKTSGAPLQPSDKYNMIQWIFPDQELAPEITALMMGVQNGKDFYISSLLSSNQIPEITGILMMAVNDGAPAAEIKNVLMQVASGQLNPEQFHVMNKPYVPELPVGIYPGQELFFIHIHLLGLDTCAMHDLKNRYPCQKNQYGGRGPLNAEQCEIAPYCCWNPVQISDEQVSTLTNKEITKAANVPWCYYNVFFIFHDQYKLKVARPIKSENFDAANIKKTLKKKEDGTGRWAIYEYTGRVGPVGPAGLGSGTVTCKYLLEDVNGDPTDVVDTAATCTVPAAIPLIKPDPEVVAKAEIDEKWAREESIWNTNFAPPAQCPGLFRYGLQLDPIVYARSVQNPLTGLGAVNTNNKVKALLNKRTDCGFPGIPKFQCVAIRGCCWDESVYNPAYKIPQCYKPIDLVPESVFKIVAPPAELMPVAGECNTNFFRVPQLYYEREACNYDFDMFKYGGIEGNKTPLDPPTLNDCIFKLGCCWEDDEEIVRKYDWVPRCYTRQRSNTGAATDVPLDLDISQLVARAAALGDE
ncbi:unnamed protein product [Oikopleura dioica]|uniref:P-type domain-containing protein n=1 Tax=Oikopleura dioica TaxID=34765 RepID=E4XX18_OIKDI|nr:unnamed protein product [Oikopleura dioica]